MPDETSASSVLKGRGFSHAILWGSTNWGFGHGVTFHYAKGTPSALKPDRFVPCVRRA